MGDFAGKTIAEILEEGRETEAIEYLSRNLDKRIKLLYRIKRMPKQVCALYTR